MDSPVGMNPPILDKAVKIEGGYAIYRYDPFGELDRIEYTQEEPKNMKHPTEEEAKTLFDEFAKAYSDWEKIESFAEGEIYTEAGKSKDSAHFWMNVIDQDSRRIYLRNAFSKWNPKWENTPWEKLPFYVRQQLSKYMNERQGKVNRTRIKRPHNASAVVRRRRNRRWRTKFINELSKLFDKKG